MDAERRSRTRRRLVLLALLASLFAGPKPPDLRLRPSLPAPTFELAGSGPSPGTPPGSGVLAGSAGPASWETHGPFAGPPSGLVDAPASLKRVFADDPWTRATSAAFLGVQVRRPDAHGRAGRGAADPRAPDRAARGAPSAAKEPFAQASPAESSGLPGLGARSKAAPDAGSASPPEDPAFLKRLKAWLNAPDWDGAASAARGTGTRRWTAPGEAASPSHRLEPDSAAARGRPQRKRRFRPPSFRKGIGAKPLEPPKGDLEPPDFSAFEKLRPAAGPGGETLARDPADPKALEALDSPNEDPAYKDWRLEDAHRRGPHWHTGSRGTLRFHNGKAWGLPGDGSWTWMATHDRLWWALGGGRQPVVAHDGHWWWRTPDGWFLLHDGQPWALRWFQEWRTRGLVHPQTGTRIIYSEDAARAAVVTPGEGAELFDAKTGALLGSWSEAQLHP